MRRAATALFLAAAAIVGSGCKSDLVDRAIHNDGGKIYRVTAETTPFFRYGPQQGSGPDMKLPRDTLVTLIRPSFGYSKVHLVKAGEDGYVATEDIRLAPPSVVAALNTPSPTAAPDAHDEPHVSPNDPRLITPAEPLPVDIPPAPSPTP